MMGRMTSTPPRTPSAPSAKPFAAARETTTDIPVHTRRWCTFVMVPIASFMNLLQVAYTALPSDTYDLWHMWLIVCTLLALPSGLILLMRTAHPLATFYTCSAVCVLLPFDSMMTLMALSALIARRSNKRLVGTAIASSVAVTLICQLRDVMRTPDSSIWHAIFAKPNTGVNGIPVQVIASTSTIIITAIIVSLLMVVFAMFIGIYIRQRALTSTAHAQAAAAQSQASTLQHNLDIRAFADAVAAEAHDTLAHSLSLLALNASALQASAHHLEETAQQPPADMRAWRQQVHQLAVSASDIRRQAAGALDEAHMVIDTLRNPEAHHDLFAPTTTTALTRDSLDALISDTRATGVTLNTWIDVRDLGQLDEMTGKLAYRIIQEGITNACRHAPGAPISLQVDANTKQGIHVHVSNPTRPISAPSHPLNTPPAPHSPTSPLTGVQQPPRQTAANNRDGAGLRGVIARVHTAGGTCRTGFDPHGVFHLDVNMPWHTHEVPPSSH